MDKKIKEAAAKIFKDYEENQSALDKALDFLEGGRDIHGCRIFFPEKVKFVDIYSRNDAAIVHNTKIVFNTLVNRYGCRDDAILAMPISAVCRLLRDKLQSNPGTDNAGAARTASENGSQRGVSGGEGEYGDYKDIAKSCGIKAENMRKRLDRWEKNNPNAKARGDIIKKPDRNQRETRKLYRLSAIPDKLKSR